MDRTAGRRGLARGILTAVLTVGVLLLAIGAGYYKESIQERAYFRVNLPQQEEQTVVVDLGAMGLPKYLVQPGRLQISAGRGGIRNTGDTPVRLKVRPSGFPGHVRGRGLTKKLLDSDGEGVALAPGQRIGLSLELDIPRTRIYQGDLGLASLEFVDTDTQQVLGRVSFDFRNSRFVLRHLEEPGS